MIQKAIFSLSFFCMIWLRLTIAVTATAADPLQPGPFPVGVKTFVFVDSDRTCPLTNKDRTLITEIWYPAAESAIDLPVNRFEQFWRNPTGIALGKVAIGMFGGDFNKVNENFKNVAHRDADMAPGQFPLLIFSHGNGGFRHQNTFQTEYLASHGYIVAACDHTGNAAVTVLPEQPLVYNKQTIRDVERWDDRPQDVSYLISHLQSLSQQPDQWLTGKLVPNEIGVFGHSFGGFTACRAAELDDRIKAILPMTLAGTLSDLKASELKEQDAEKLQQLDIKNANCRIPLMVILGDHDRTVDDKGNQRSIGYYRRATGPKYLLNFKNAGHYTFTEVLQVNPNFGDGIGSEEAEDGNPAFQFSDAAVDQQITNQYSTAFFDAYLKQDAQALKFLKTNHYPDEFVFEADAEK